MGSMAFIVVIWVFYEKYVAVVALLHLTPKWVVILKNWRAKTSGLSWHRMAHKNML